MNSTSTANRSSLLSQLEMTKWNTMLERIPWPILTPVPWFTTQDIIICVLNVLTLPDSGLKILK